MRWLRHSRGFTIIELVLVIAIAGLLLAGVVAGGSGLFQNSAFTSAMDNAQNLMRQIQNEANQALSTNQVGTGQSNVVVFGRLAQLSTTYTAPDTASTLKTWTLIGAKDDTGNVVALSACDEEDDTLQDGVTYNPASPGTTSLIFTRDTGNAGNANATATGGQIFSLVSPLSAPSTPGLPIDGVLLPGASPCPAVGAPLPSSQPPQVGVQDPCTPLGETDQRNPGSATLSCNGVTPAAPEIQATDNEGVTANSLDTPPGSDAITTYAAPLTLTVTLPISEPGATVTLSDSANSAASSTAFTCVATTCTAPYTLTSYGPHVLTATWSYTGSYTSPSSGSVTVTYSVSNACPGGSLYVCGLTGFYYKKGATTPNTTIVDQQVGCDLKGLACNAAGDGPKTATDPSSYNDFTATLEQRTGFRVFSVQNDTVDWSGQIYLKPGSQQVCIDSNSPAILKIGGSAAITGTGGTTPVCGTYSGAAITGTWSNITIDYTDTVASTPYVRLVDPNGTASQTEICAISQGLFFGAPTVCDTSPTNSDINICKQDGDTTDYFDDPPPDLPSERDGSTQYYVCKVSTTTTTSYQEIPGSQLRTTLIPPANVKTVGLARPSMVSTDIALATAPSLPYSQLVQTIEKQAQATPTSAQVGESGLTSVFRAIARAIGPNNALAAVGTCDTNILNPANYLSDCPTFTNNSTTISVPVTVSGARNANLNFDPNSNTITWSIQ
jgi:prepilin-type N-terminal cleavage/methylation domain-containing protein